MGELIQKCSDCSEIYQCFPFSHKYNLHQISKHWTNGQRKKLSVLLEQHLPIDPIQETFQLIDDYYYTIITTISRTQQHQQQQQQQPQQQQNNIIEPKVELCSTTNDSIEFDFDKNSRNLVEHFSDHNSQENIIKTNEPEKILKKNVNSIKTELISLNSEQKNPEQYWQNHFDDKIDGLSGGDCKVGSKDNISGFSCEICGQILKRKSSLTVHMKNIHKINNKNNKVKITRNSSLDEEFNTTVKENGNVTTAALNNVDDKTFQRAQSPSHDDNDDDYLVDDTYDVDITSDEDYQVKETKSTKQLNKKPSNNKQSKKISSKSSEETIKKPPKSVGMKTGELYTCEYCSKTFTRKRYYETHTERHRGLKELLKKRRQNKKHLCPICGKRYPAGYHLKIHMFVHGDDRPLKCDICGKGFVIKKTLREHMHIHTGARPYLCDIEGCGKSFTHATGKRQHFISVHSGIKRFECEQCKKRFAKKIDFQEHLRKHTGERPFSCEFCPMKFRLSVTLRAHTKTHTGERPFTCHICNKGFIKSHNLKVHLSAKRSCADRLSNSNNSQGKEKNTIVMAKDNNSISSLNI